MRLIPMSSNSIYATLDEIATNLQGNSPNQSRPDYAPRLDSGGIGTTRHRPPKFRRLPATTHPRVHYKKI